MTAWSKEIALPTIISIGLFLLCKLANRWKKLVHLSPSTIVPLISVSKRSPLLKKPYQDLWPPNTYKFSQLRRGLASSSLSKPYKIYKREHFCYTTLPKAYSFHCVKIILQCLLLASHYDTWSTLKEVRSPRMPNSVYNSGVPLSHMFSNLIYLHPPQMPQQSKVNEHNQGSLLNYIRKMQFPIWRY